MDLDELKDLAKDLPVHEPSQERATELRASLLASVEREPIRPRGRVPWVAGAGLVAAAAAIAFYAGTRHGAGQRERGVDEGNAAVAVLQAKLSSPEGATFERRVVASESGPIEAVELVTGDLRVEAHPTRALQVLTKDARVEGIASFDIEAKDNTLQAIRVESGTLEIRIASQPPVVLGPGDYWKRPTTAVLDLALATPPAALLPSAGGSEEEHEELVGKDNAPNDSAVKDSAQSANLRTLRNRKPIRETHVPSKNAAAAEGAAEPEATLPQGEEATTRPGAAEDIAARTLPEAGESSSEVPLAPAGPSGAEVAFDAGYRATKRGDFAHAIVQLDLAIAEADDTRLRADARYWRIIALARAGRPAEGAMREFLASHSDHARSGEVATMLGWAYVEQGQPRLAAPLFQRGSKDASSRVRSSALEGLQAISGQ